MIFVSLWIYQWLIGVYDIMLSFLTKICKVTYPCMQKYMHGYENKEFLLEILSKESLDVDPFHDLLMYLTKPVKIWNRNLVSTLYSSTFMLN